MIAAIESDVRARNGNNIACNTMPDHVHLLINLPPTISPAIFIGQVIGAVSHAYHAEFGVHEYMKWQEGYGVVSMRKNSFSKYLHTLRIKRQSMPRARHPRLWKELIPATGN